MKKQYTIFVCLVLRIVPIWHLECPHVCSSFNYTRQVESVKLLSQSNAITIGLGSISAICCRVTY